MTDNEIPETSLAFVDGRDALAYVIIRPNDTGDGVVVESGANGITKPQAGEHRSAPGVDR
jgi:hypothetical protein